HLFADEVMVEVLEQRRRLAGNDIEQKGVALVLVQVGNDRVGHHLGLGGGEERLATGTNRQVQDVVGAEVVQEPCSLGAGQLDLPARGKVEQGGAFPRGLVFGGAVGGGGEFGHGKRSVGRAFLPGRPARAEMPVPPLETTAQRWTASEKV